MDMGGDDDEIGTGQDKVSQQVNGHSQRKRLTQSKKSRASRDQSQESERIVKRGKKKRRAVESSCDDEDGLDVQKDETTPEDNTL